MGEEVASQSAAVHQRSPATGRSSELFRSVQIPPSGMPHYPQCVGVCECVCACVSCFSYASIMPYTEQLFINRKYLHMTSLKTFCMLRCENLIAYNSILMLDASLVYVPISIVIIILILILILILIFHLISLLHNLLLIQLDNGYTGTWTMFSEIVCAVSSCGSDYRAMPPLTHLCSQ